MERLIYSVLAMTDDAPRSCEIYQALEKDQHYAMRRLDSKTQQAEKVIASDRPDVIILLTRVPQLLQKNWLIRITEKTGVPGILISTEMLSPTDPISNSKTVQYLHDDGNMQISTMVLTLGIKIRLAANQSVAKRRAGTQRNKENPPVQVLQKPANARKFGRQKLIAIGASMGGVEAVNRVLEKLPAEMPGIVIVQHMPKGFTDMYAQRLNGCCKLKVVQAADNQKVEEGTAYIAPGDFHMTLHKSPEGDYVIRIIGGERVTGHKPSVNVLFRSVAKCAGKDALGVILTGMGDDGAQGLLELRKTGAHTIGQDAESALVYGMPKVAYEIGAVCEQVPLMEVPSKLLKYAYE
jgi:two-component system chemotaxis response regulator CheB